MLSAIFGSFSRYFIVTRTVLNALRVRKLKCAARCVAAILLSNRFLLFAFARISVHIHRRHVHCTHRNNVSDSRRAREHNISIFGCSHAMNGIWARLFGSRHLCKYIVFYSNSVLCDVRIPFNTSLEVETFDSKTIARQLLGCCYVLVCCMCARECVYD